MQIHARLFARTGSQAMDTIRDFLQWNDNYNVPEAFEYMTSSQIKAELRDWNHQAMRGECATTRDCFNRFRGM